MRRLILALAILPFLTAGAAVASPLVVSANRNVAIGAGGVPYFDEALSGAGPFSKSLLHPVAVPGGSLVSVAAAQSTLVDGAAGVFSGSGSAGIGYSVQASQEVYASSFFDVFFDLAMPHAYTLSGGLTAMDDGGFARARLGLTGPVALAFLAIGTDPNTPLSSSGVLPAGSYRFVVEAAMDRGNSQDGAYLGGSAEFDFRMELVGQGTPVPEPATLVLLGLGLAWSARKRARR